MIPPTLASGQTCNPAHATAVADQIWPRALANVTQRGMTAKQAAEEAVKRVKASLRRYAITA